MITAKQYKDNVFLRCTIQNLKDHAARVLKKYSYIMKFTPEEKEIINQFTDILAAKLEHFTTAAKNEKTD